MNKIPEDILSEFRKYFKTEDILDYEYLNCESFEEHLIYFKYITVLGIFRVTSDGSKQTLFLNGNQIDKLYELKKNLPQCW